MSMKIEDFDETELRLGLPGRAKHHEISSTTNVNGKRGFDETNVDLKLKLSSKKMEIDSTDHNMIIKNTTTTQLDKDSSAKPPAAKAQVVGWPPVRSYRKNIVASQKRGTEHQESDKHVMGNAAAALVKVSMDGAPFLRKVDLNMYKSYQDLSDALAKMFTSFTTGKWEVEGTKDFMNESKLMDLLNSSDYVPTYEDKDGDWMLVGDVPWGMFVESCKRLRIMKGTEAIGQHLGLARNARTEAEVVSTNSTTTTCSFDLDGETTIKGDKIHKMN